MAVSISMSIFQNSQSIENNTSNVTVEVYAHWTKGSYNAQTAQDGYPDARGTVTIDDVAYAFYSKFNTGHTISGSERIFVKTLDIDHNNEGEKVLSCWASYATGVSSGTVSTSGSLALATIPRKSILKATDGVLGIEQILKVERKSSILTHTVAYQCNAESGILCEKSGTTEIAWIPPLSLAAHYPSATSVPIVFTVTTYHGDKEIGSSAVTVTYAVPESVKPAVSLEVSDLMGCFAKYGAYVQKKSRLRIAVAASANQGARITAYRIEADGKNYTNSTAITEPISGSGDLTVKATVTDTRGRTETASLTIPVMAYMSPNISAVTVERTDERGNTDPSGAYLTVLFNAEVTALGKKNSAVYTIQYKKTNEAHYSLHTASDYTGQHTVNNGVFTFAAETVSSYDILVTVSDDYESGSKACTGSSIKKTWSMHKNGLGFAFGKIAEVANCLDMGWFIKMNGNRITDLGTPTDSKDAVNKEYADGTFLPLAGGDIKQRAYIDFMVADSGITWQYDGEYYVMRPLPGVGLELLANNGNGFYAPIRILPDGYLVLGNMDIGSTRKLSLWEDGEGGNIEIDSPGGHSWHIDAFDNNLRVYHSYYSEGIVHDHYLKLTTDGKLLVDGHQVTIKTLLWHNAAPHESHFYAQTLALDLSYYDAIEIVFTVDPNSVWEKNVAKFMKNAYGHMQCICGARAEGLSMFSVQRVVYVSNTGIQFEDAYSKYLGDTTLYAGSDRLVPVDIYGLREVS